MRVNQMRSKDIIAEKPASAEANPAVRAQQQDNRRVDNRTANQSQDSLQGGSSRLQQKRAELGNARRKEKSKQGGPVSDYGNEKAIFKPGKLIAHPNGFFYELQVDRNYAEVTGVTKNKKTGELTAGPRGPERPQGGMVVTPDSALGKQLVTLTKDPQAKVDQSMADKAKDAVGGAVSKAADKLGMGNLAAKTRSNPDASTAQKIGGTVGAGIGRAMANVLRRPKGQPAPDKKPMTKTSVMDLKSKQTMIMNPEAPAEQRLQVAQDMISQMATQHAKGIDVNAYLDSLGPALKKSGLNKTNPTEYQAMVTQARGMRNEAYQHMSKVLEAVGLTWEDAGYTVLISETITDHVVLIPIKDLQLSQLKTLAGV